MNEQTEKKYRVTDANKKLITARWKDGFRLEDFKTVHRTMSIKWKNDPEWNKYLRPITLYRVSKFDGYLNDKVFLSDKKVISVTTEKAAHTIKEWLNSGNQNENHDG